MGTERRAEGSGAGTRSTPVLRGHRGPAPHRGVRRPPALWDSRRRTPASVAFLWHLPRSRGVVTALGFSLSGAVSAAQAERRATIGTERFPVPVPLAPGSFPPNLEGCEASRTQPPPPNQQAADRPLLNLSQRNCAGPTRHTRSLRKPVAQFHATLSWSAARAESWSPHRPPARGALCLSPRVSPPRVPGPRRLAFNTWIWVQRRAAGLWPFKPQALFRRSALVSLSVGAISQSQLELKRGPQGPTWQGSNLHRGM